jgi:hypothetical protein
VTTRRTYRHTTEEEDEYDEVGAALLPWWLPSAISHQSAGPRCFWWTNVPVEYSASTVLVLVHVHTSAGHD